MKEAIKVFVNDYKNVMNVSKEFYINHWKGLVVISAVTFGTEIAVFEIVTNRDKIKRKLKSVKKVKVNNRKEQSES